MFYKINLHAHTIFSDGKNTPYVMAMEARRLGFSALVITDHFYDSDYDKGINADKMKLLKKACIEAKHILPIIIGLEIPFIRQEILVFGGAAIKYILNNGIPTSTALNKLRTQTNCATILCHPGKDYQHLLPYVDGYEQYNSGQNWFSNRELITNKPRWCNSDAHQAIELKQCHNLTTTKIINENKLINYIKKGKQPHFTIKGEHYVSHS